MALQSYVVGMLTNFDSLPLDRIHNMLKVQSISQMTIAFSFSLLFYSILVLLNIEPFLESLKREFDLISLLHDQLTEHAIVWDGVLGARVS